MPKEDTSWLGRYLAQKAYRNQSRADDTRAMVKTLPTASMQAIAPIAPLAYQANEFLLNEAVQGKDPVKAKKILEKSRKGAESRSWSDQLKHGLKKSPAWALGGGIGSGVAGYLASKYMFKDTNPPTSALSSAAVGGGVGAALPVLYALASKGTFDRVSTNEDKKRALEYLSQHPNRSVLPFGDALGAVKRKK